LTTNALVIEAGDTMSTFDTYADGYQAAVDASVTFAGQDLAFFTAAKVFHLLRLARSLDRPLGACQLLDVGCGPGVTDQLLTGQVGRIAGVDISAAMVEEAARRNPGCDYQVYDGHRLPFEPGRFDLAFAICVMHHIPPAQWHAFAAELWQAVRPGGVAVVIEHNPVNPLTRRAVRDCEFDADAVLLSPRQVEEAFRISGAPRTSLEYILFAPFGQQRVRQLERGLRWLALGAQYVVAARRPSAKATSR
jgi:SAM-dependent methyltransferase